MTLSIMSNDSYLRSTAPDPKLEQTQLPLLGETPTRLGQGMRLVRYLKPLLVEPPTVLSTQLKHPLPKPPPKLRLRLSPVHPQSPVPLLAEVPILTHLAVPQTAQTGLGKSIITSLTHCKTSVLTHT